MTKYSVVACDQYTSQPEYWKAARALVNGEVSALNMIFPEADFKTADFDKTVEAINRTMRDYCSKSVFNRYGDCMIYLERTLKSGKIRRGLIGKIDLEQYDFSKDSGSAVRATEGTVLDRLPPRVKIRRDAPLELPHIMTLIDDRSHEVIEPIRRRLGNFNVLYSFDLMMDSGSVKGYALDKSEQTRVLNALDLLAADDAYTARYGAQPLDKKLIYAVGDGNHSLATARQVYLDLKADIGEKALESPARYALTELVNLHDEALEFEAIHRVCTGVNAQKLLAALDDCCALSDTAQPSSQQIDVVLRGVIARKYIAKPTKNLSVGSLQAFLDKYLDENGGECDYIHGADVVSELSKQENSVGFLLPCMDKNDLYSTVIKDGALPRKTFSMGEACDKRFYLEAREIK